MTMAGAVIASAVVAAGAITAEADKRPIVLTPAAETQATQRQFAPAAPRPTLAAALHIKEARDLQQGMSGRRTALLMQQHRMPQQRMRAAGHTAAEQHTAVVENTSSLQPLNRRHAAYLSSGAELLRCFVFLRRCTLADSASSDAPTAVRYD